MSMGTAPNQNQTRNVEKTQLKPDAMKKRIILTLQASFIMMVMQRMVMAIMIGMLSLMSMSDDEDDDDDDDDDDDVNANSS